MSLDDDYEEGGELVFRVILKARDIPLNSTVTKIRGEKVYYLRNSLLVYSESGYKRLIEAEEGTAFLVCDRGDANSISLGKELVWKAPIQELVDMLGDL